MDIGIVDAFLISNSRSEEFGYLGHVRDAIHDFLGIAVPEKKVLFVPYAAVDKNNWNSYAKQAGDFFEDLGYGFVSVHTLDISSSSKQGKIFKDIYAVFVGGGNTYCLLDRIREYYFDLSLKNRVFEGVKYIGSSAGSVIACPTIKTTNDWQIVIPRRMREDNLKGLGLIPWQINPHFVKGSLIPNHMGETREDRIKEFHQENLTPVIGLPEGSWLEVNGNVSRLMGMRHATLFKKDCAETIWELGTSKTMK